MRPSCAATASTCASGYLASQHRREQQSPVADRLSVGAAMSLVQCVGQNRHQLENAPSRAHRHVSTSFVELLVQQRIGFTRTTAELIKLCFRLFEVGVD